MLKNEVVVPVNEALILDLYQPFNDVLPACFFSISHFLGGFLYFCVDVSGACCSVEDHRCRAI